MKKYFYLFLPSFCFLLFCFFVFSNISHAEDIYFPMSQNYNGHFTESDKTQLDTLLDNENYYIFIRWDAYSGTNNRYKNALFVKYAKSSSNGLFGEIQNNGYSFNLYKSGTLSCTVGAIQCDTRTGVWSIYRTYGDVVPSYFSNMQSSLYTTSTDYMSNFKVYRSNVENADVVLKYGPDNPMVDIGTAILPGPFIDPIYSTGDTPPDKVPPSFTINNYTWTTNNPPSFDTSSVENAIESLGDIVTYQIEWLAENLNGEFNTLTSNIKGLVEYIGKTLQYYGNAIIESINNGIQNFYDNMSNLVQPIFDKVNYITEPFDSSEVTAAFTSTNFYGIKNQFTTFFTAFDNAFDFAEPDSFTLIINIQNIRTLYNFGCTEPITINLGANFLPIRSALRTFLWVLVSFGSVFVVEHGLSNWLRGERNT